MKKMTLLLLTALFLLSCGARGDTEKVSGIPRDEVEVSNPADYTGMISSYTAGILSRNSPISVILAKGADKELGEQQVQKLIQLDPAVKGKTTLSEDGVIEFVPEKGLASGQFYTASLRLGDVLDVPAGKEEFSFSFSTIVQDVEVLIDRVDALDSETMSVYGRVKTADLSDAEGIEEMLAPPSLPAPIQWSHKEDSHSFVIHEIPRKEVAYALQLEWNGKSIGVDRQGVEEIPIPALNRFDFMSWKNTLSPVKAVELSFSMPLDTKQEISGLARIGGEEMTNLKIKDNRIILYTERVNTAAKKLMISSSLKNADGVPLGREIAFTLPHEQQKPLARFTTEGGILPSGERLLIPIESISLKAVDIEIIRVYENNMVQFLQDNNDIKGGYNIQKVGRPVAFKTVSLEGRGIDNLNIKNKFDLDLTPWVDLEPGALYQLRLSFRRSQSLYPCEHDHSEEDDLPLNKSEWTGPSYRSNWDNYYYSDWRNRDNPCSNTYYARRTDKVSFLSSNLGVIAKKSDVSGMTVYVSDLNTSEAVAGAEVVLYDFQQQEIARGVSDNSGYLFLNAKRVPFALQATSGGMSSWMRVDNGSSLSVSDFEVEGGSVKEGLKGFIYGERGVWRPGDTIHLGFILQDEMKTLPEEHPVIFELFDPEDKRVLRMVSTSSTGGIYRFDADTGDDAPTGFWNARISVGGTSFSKALRVETVKPNRLKISLDVPGEAIRSELTSIPMDVTWLHGAVARDLKTETDMILSAHETSFKGYGSFEFDDPSKEFYSPSETVFSGRIDSNGHADIRLPIPFEAKSPGFMTVDLQTKVFEEGGDFSITRNLMTLSPYDSYAGIRPPAGDTTRGMLLTDQDHEIEIVSLDADGRPSGRKTLEVEMYKLDWKWWWDRSEEDLARFVSRNYRRALSREKISLSEGRGSWSFRIDYPEWGRYLVRVIDPVSGHSTGKIIYVDWPGWAGSPQRGSSISRLNFFAEKEEYNTGEQAVITIPSEEGGRILVSLEDGTGVINSWWVPSLSEQTRIEFPVEAAMAPTVYVHASYVQPYERSSNDLPVRMYGIIPLNVTDPATRLEPVIKTAPQYEPQGQVSITISEKQGRPMAYTLAVVDDGLLDLTNFKTPDPWSDFFAKETLGVRTWDIYDDLIASRAGDFGTLLSIGGGEGADPEPPKKASRFKPVVRYFGPFELAEGESGEHEFEMPLYVGSVRVMAVAASASAYGHTEKTVPVRTDLMVLGTLPRVLGPEEEILLPVNVFSHFEQGGTATVTVKAGGPLEIIDEGTQETSFDGPSDKYVYFKARSLPETGPVRVRFDAEMDGKRAQQVIDFEVRASNPPTTRVTPLVLEGGKDITLPLEPFGLEDQFSQLLEVSSLPPLNLEKRLDYLIRYPHGCVEQTVSAVFPQLYLPRLAELSESRSGELEGNIRKAIDKLARFQLKEGGYAYWSGALRPSPWGTSYALHFLLEARKAGYHVPSQMIDDGLAYQKGAANRWQPGGEESSLNQAYRLYSLALAGEADTAGMNRLKDSDALTDAALWKLASAYVLIGRKDVAKGMTRNANSTIATSYETDSFGSAVRDRALVLEALALMGEKRKGDQLFRNLAAQLSSSEWMSTQTAAYTLISISAWLGDDRGNERPSFTWALDAAKPQQHRSESRYSFIDLPPQNGSLKVSNTGSELLYLNLIARGVPLRGEDRDEASNLNMQIWYKPKNPEEGFDPKSLLSGTDFIMTVRITNPGGQPRRENLALEQILPAGWEIINPRIYATAGDAEKGSFDHQEIRDDRINTYFDLDRGESKEFSVMLNASYKGEYYQPSVRCGAMYDDTVSAVKAGRPVEVR